MMDNIIIALFLGFVVLLIVLDIAMVVSLVKSGDERRQLIGLESEHIYPHRHRRRDDLECRQNVCRARGDFRAIFSARRNGDSFIFCCLFYYKRKLGG